VVVEREVLDFTFTPPTANCQQGRVTWFLWHHQNDPIVIESSVLRLSSLWVTGSSFPEKSGWRYHRMSHWLCFGYLRIEIHESSVFISHLVNAKGPRYQQLNHLKLLIATSILNVKPFICETFRQERDRSNSHNPLSLSSGRCQEVQSCIVVGMSQWVSKRRCR